MRDNLQDFGSGSYQPPNSQTNHFSTPQQTPDLVTMTEDQIMARYLNAPSSETGPTTNDSQTLDYIPRLPQQQVNAQVHVSVQNDMIANDSSGDDMEWTQSLDDQPNSDQHDWQAGMDIFEPMAVPSDGYSPMVLFHRAEHIRWLEVAFEDPQPNPVVVEAQKDESQGSSSNPVQPADQGLAASQAQDQGTQQQFVQPTEVLLNPANHPSYDQNYYTPASIQQSHKKAHQETSRSISEEHIAPVQQEQVTEAAQSVATDSNSDLEMSSLGFDALREFTSDDQPQGSAQVVTGQEARNHDSSKFSIAQTTQMAFQFLGQGAFNDTAANILAKCYNRHYDEQRFSFHHSRISFAEVQALYRMHATDEEKATMEQAKRQDLAVQRRHQTREPRMNTDFPFRLLTESELPFNEIYQNEANQFSQHFSVAAQFLFAQIPVSEHAQITAVPTEVNAEIMSTFGPNGPLAKPRLRLERRKACQPCRTRKAKCVYGADPNGKICGECYKGKSERAFEADVDITKMCCPHDTLDFQKYKEFYGGVGNQKHRDEGWEVQRDQARALEDAQAHANRGVAIPIKTAPRKEDEGESFFDRMARND